MTHRAVLYARVSTRRPGDQDPEVQLDALRTWAKVRGWTVVEEHSDRVTGDPSRRRGDPPGLRSAMRVLEERRADVLAVFAADRLVRSTVALLNLVGRVQTMGAHVASYQDGGDLDTTTDMGELVVFLRGWMARMELRLTRSRIRAGLDRARRDGKTLGRPRVEVCAREVRRLRDGEGLTWAEVADRLDTSVATVRRRYVKGEA